MVQGRGTHATPTPTLSPLLAPALRSRSNKVGIPPLCAHGGSEAAGRQEVAGQVPTALATCVPGSKKTAPTHGQAIATARTLKRKKSGAKVVGCSRISASSSESLAGCVRIVREA